MRYSFEIDYLKKNITIDRFIPSIVTELNRQNKFIDKFQILYSIEKKQIKTFSIDKPIYRTISINVPFFSDWVILQNDYLPCAGEYFLN